MHTPKSVATKLHSLHLDITAYVCARKDAHSEKWFHDPALHSPRHHRIPLVLDSRENARAVLAWFAGPPYAELVRQW